MNQIRLMVVMLNFCVNCFLLIGTNQITGEDSTCGKILLGSGIGALYSFGCMQPALSLLRQLHWRAIVLLLISGAAFSWDWDGMKKGIVFTAASVSLQGSSMLIGRDGFLPMILAAGAIWMAPALFSIFRRKVPMEIQGSRETVHLTALKDTGNSLRDPVSGESVIIVGSDTAEKLTGLTDSQLKNPLLTLSKKRIRGLRVIPYKSVGQEHGLLLAMRFANVTIGGQMQSRIIAFAPHIIGGDSFQALTGGII